MEVSNPDRVVFPEAGITKGEVVAYYAAVGHRMLRHVAGRPLTLERYPRGIGAPGFMQKNVADHFPDYIGRLEMPRRDGVTVHPVVQTVDGLAYLANQGTITFHIPPAGAGDARVPDRLVIDLDPSVEDHSRTRDAAATIRAFLEVLGLPSLLLATGSKGYHLVVPVRESTFEQTGALAHTLATLAAHQHPDLLTVEFLKRDRGRRVLVDWMRNGWGATSVAPWSLRPRPGAPAAIPLAWDELPAVAPGDVDLHAAVERSDPWPDFADLAQPAGPAVEAAAEALAAAGLELVFVDRFGRKRNGDA